jgi:hypothetical protein
MRFAALLLSLLALSIAPARSAEIATPDDTARFLAGLPPSPDSPLAPLTRQQHANHFNAIFGQEDREHLAKVRAFSKARLSPTHDTLLYMFSGPDALHALALFPSASTYVLAGLEPAGNIPPLNGLSRATVSRTLRGLESALGNLFKLSYFITKNMQNQLRPGPVYGTLPVIYVFLARSGQTIHETKFVNIDNEGIERAADEPGVKTAAKGVKVTFSAGEGPKQTLYYFSTNLTNDGVKSSGFLAFCDKLGVADSFVKSAAWRQFLDRAQLPARPQRDHPAGRHRHSGEFFRPQEMAAAAVRPLCHTDRRVFAQLSAQAGGAVPQGQPDPDRFRSRIPLAGQPIEPAAGPEDRRSQAELVSSAAETLPHETTPAWSASAAPSTQFSRRTERPVSKPVRTRRFSRGH